MTKAIPSTSRASFSDTLRTPHDPTPRARLRRTPHEDASRATRSTSRHCEAADASPRIGSTAFSLKRGIVGFLLLSGGHLANAFVGVPQPTEPGEPLDPGNETEPLRLHIDTASSDDNGTTTDVLNATVLGDENTTLAHVPSADVPSGDEPWAAPPSTDSSVSTGTIRALAAAGAVSALHWVPALLSHRQVPGSTWASVLQRHESLLGENLSVRGLLQMYAYAQLASPEALAEGSLDDLLQWTTAALVGFNARLLLETAESAYVWPGRPCSTAFSRMRDALFTPCTWKTGLFPLSAGVGLPLADALDRSGTVGKLYETIGWGTPAGGAGHVPPPGFNNAQGHAWFQTRFHFTAVLSELFNAYGMLKDGEATWDWADNGVGAALNLWLTPQIGATMVTATQLIPIVARINAIQHGTAGTGCTRSMSGNVVGRALTYAIATPLLTWPEYDIVLTMMANVPNGHGGITGSGIYACIRDHGRPCVAGPTSAMHQASDGSPWAFVPLTASTLFQLASLLALKRRIDAARQDADAAGAAGAGLPLTVPPGPPSPDVAYPVPEVERFELRNIHVDDSESEDELENSMLLSPRLRSPRSPESNKVSHQEALRPRSSL